MNGFRQVVLFSILALYLLGNVHISLAKHYCGGELEAISLYEPISCCDDEEEENGCCKNEIVSFSQDNHHKQAVEHAIKSTQVLEASQVYIAQLNPTEVAFSTEVLQASYLLFKPPPLRRFLVFCCLVI